MPRPTAAVVALVAACAAIGAQSPVPRAAAVTIHAVVERPEPSVGPGRVVPWTVVTDLRREDFEISSDGEAQPVDSFSTDDSPITIVVLVDLSASTGVKIDALREPLRKFLPALRPGDRVAFGRFGGTATRVDRRFTGERRELEIAVNALLAPAERPSDPILDVKAGNGAFGLRASPAWDAVDTATTVLESQSGRRAILLVTDGRSSGNVLGLDDAIPHAVAADVSVSIVGEAQQAYLAQDGSGYARIRPSVFLESMAETTGGGYADLFGPETGRPSVSDDAAIERWLGSALAHLVGALHSAYTLSFVPARADGRGHALEVRVKRPGLKVRARRAYVALPPLSAP